jgi:hypothetical protein
MASNHPPAKAFIRAVWDCEQSRSADGVCALFAPGATLDSIAFGSPIVGPKSIAAFWKEYLTHFQSITTKFHHAIDTPGTTVLEWSSTGKLTDGTPIHYRGVTILDWSGEQVKSMRTYYDSAAFMPGFEKVLGRMNLNR